MSTLRIFRVCLRGGGTWRLAIRDPLTFDLCCLGLSFVCWCRPLRPLRASRQPQRIVSRLITQHNSSYLSIVVHVARITSIECRDLEARLHHLVHVCHPLPPLFGRCSARRSCSRPHPLARAPARGVFFSIPATVYLARGEAVLPAVQRQRVPSHGSRRSPNRHEGSFCDSVRLVCGRHKHT